MILRLAEQQADCHGRALKTGWWDEYMAGDSTLKRHFIRGKIGLVHSEVSESLEGYRKNTPDEHLPHRRSVEVEFADAVIRIFDISGALRLDIEGAIVENSRFYNPVDWNEYLAGDRTVQKHFVAGAIANVHTYISAAFEGFDHDAQDTNLPHRKMIEVKFSEAVVNLYDIGGMLQLDIHGAMLEKLAYNAVRADHTREARAAEGGKTL